jgi:hypothetical protein
LEETRSCTCNGSNENCTHCYGTGTVTRKLLGPLYFSKRPKRRLQQPDLSPLLRKYGTEEIKKIAEAALASKMESCDRCKFRGLPEELREHKRNAHRSPTPSTHRVIIDSHPAVRRPLKKQQTKNTNPGPVSSRAKHRKKKRHQLHWEGPSNDSLRRDAIKRGLIKPGAGNDKGRTKLQPSIGSAPRGSKMVVVVQPPRGRKGDRGHEKGIERCIESGNQVDKLQFFDTREAHRAMGFFARENGRYRSHPLHDRFDDESEP